MRSLAAFLGVNLFFSVGAVIAAGTIAGLGLLAKETGLGDEPFVWLGIGMVGLCACIGALWAATRAIGRSS